ncbi:Uncharacterized membrane protein YgdD, TMEM256/DUF423 family [Filimonas lacunae]|uniref:Uncharacterized membrane protein YgdD, TMEM256/DUF423 family n=1 Tax=Filimonas lacunae TaxID=477680 RepID=A0A173ML84_9BACT|nr:DUF423 domain-containing protein [Filimonas lacunae]BAV08393.1 hypothetical protein FLA_4429 [Filimonas lacunae]SIT33495.1 Uncharacterized membrane protein YgdD, TMEM256/DUF423 family [Filimonas lacunae]
MHKPFFKLAAFLGALAVILGAFGAHKLKEIVPAPALAIFETGVKYQFYHVFALLITALAWKEFPNKWLQYAGTLFVLGIILFSGSLYVLTWLTAASEGGPLPAIGKVIGPVTPVGGLFFIAGWLLLAKGVMEHKD